MEKRRIPGLLVFIWLLISASTPVQAASLYVYETAVSIYEKPEADLTPLHRLSYGEQVTVADATSMVGDWTKAKVEGETASIVGYVHAEALLPFPAPDLSVSGFQSLTDQLQKIGTATSERIDDVTTLTQDYEHGITLTTRTLHSSYGDFEEKSLEISGITVAQGFLLARALVIQDGATSEHMTRVPNIQKDTQGHLFVFDDSHWQIISVKQEQDGVVVMFPERAD